MRLCVCVLLMATGLISCSSMPTTPVQGQWSTLDWPQWQVEGRLSLQYQEQNWSLSVRWRQYLNTYDMVFNGPMGIGTMRLDVDEKSARLTHNDGSQSVARDAQQLLYEQMGVQLPLVYLRYWILANIAPFIDGQQTLDDSGRPLRIEQDGWVIQYKRYQDIDGRVVPRLIHVTGEELKLRLVIDGLTRLPADAQSL